jgi:uncharacterized protein YcbK (DUF882 family)
MKKPYVGIHPKMGYRLCRRGFLKAGVLALGGCIFPKALLGAVQGPQKTERSLSLYNLHTGEALKTAYWFKGEYLSEALSEINHILRDFRTGEIKPIDTGLLDLLHTIHDSLGSQEMLHIISGYRSPVTNNRLHEYSCGVANHSLHLQGKAADIRLPGCSLSTLRQTAVSLKRGGVGYYPGSDFIHVDVGRVRYW